MSAAGERSEHSSTRGIDAAGLRELQKPLKDRYREDPASALVTSRAEAAVATDSITATVDGWAGPVRAGLHPAAGGDGGDACSGDIVLEALAACAGVTLRSVATAMRLPLERAVVRAEGVWDARGTLGVDKTAAVGFTEVTLTFDVALAGDAATDPSAGKNIERLVELTERYCVVAQTLQRPPHLAVRLA